MCCNKVLNKSLSIIIASLIIAVQIIAVIPTITLAASDTNVMKITTKAHVQDIGWMSPVTTNSDGNVSGMGTTHQSKRMEALQISLDAPAGVNLKYRAHIQDIGWTG